MEELELTQEQIERNDEIDNAVHECICILAEKDLEWDMHIIGNVTETIKIELEKHNIHVRHPGIIMNEDGSEEYAE